MHTLNPVRARKIEAIRWRLPALSRIEAVCPADGPRGEEVTIIVVVPANGDDGIQPLYFPYAVPIVMEAIAREAGWDLAAAGAFGQRFAPMHEGGIYPLLPMVFTAVKMRCRMFHNQNVWGYLNAAGPIEAIVPDTPQRRVPGSRVVFADGQSVHSSWSARTVEHKIQTAKSVSRLTGLELILEREARAHVWCETPLHRREEVEREAAYEC